MPSREGLLRITRDSPEAADHASKTRLLCKDKNATLHSNGISNTYR